MGGAVTLRGLFQSVSFSISGGTLTARLRAMTFRSILSQEMGWFDLEENSSAALSTKLASDVPLVQGVRGPSLPPVFSPTPTYFPSPVRPLVPGLEC